MADNLNDIERYQKGLMTDAERHAFEKRALTDPFLFDALEGAESVTPDEFVADVQSISKRITSQSSRSRFTPWRVAAAIAALITLGSVLYLIQPGSNPPAAAIETGDSSYVPNEPVVSEVGKANPDSLSTLLALDKVDQARANKTLSSPSVTSQADGQSRSEGADKMLELESTDLRPVDDKSQEIVSEEIQQSQQIAKEKNKATPTVAKPDAWSGGLSDSERKKETSRSKSIAGETAKDDSGIVDLVIQGVVSSAMDRTPLPGVRVTVKGSADGTRTDSNGYFRLHTTKQYPQIVFSFAGFHTEETKVKSGKLVNLFMGEDNSPLSEVVASGLSSGRSPTDEVRPSSINMATPAGGMKAYNKYLENSLRYPKEALENKVKGQVTLQFIVSTDGSLSSFQVLQGPGFGCDEEAIRMIKEGPSWTPATQDDLAVESEVRVRIKFDPEKARN